MISLSFFRTQVLLIKDLHADWCDLTASIAMLVISYEDSARAAGHSQHRSTCLNDIMSSVTCVLTLSLSCFVPTFDRARI